MDGYLAEVKVFAGNFAPRGWAFCDGQLLEISSNQALFSLIGTIYGGDGRTDFALPDLRGRSPIGPGQGPGLSNIQEGQKTGLESVTLSVNELPSHTHAVTVETTINVSKALADNNNPKDKVLAKTDLSQNMNIYNSETPNAVLNDSAVTTVVTVGDTGGNQSVFTRSPGLGMYWIICLEGQYPERN